MAPNTMNSEAVRIPIVCCGECSVSFDVVEWAALALVEVRKVEDSEPLELRRCAMCAATLAVPLGLLADAADGAFMATVEQYEQLYPETARPAVVRARWRAYFERLKRVFR